MTILIITLSLVIISAVVYFYIRLMNWIIYRKLVNKLESTQITDSEIDALRNAFESFV